MQNKIITDRASIAHRAITQYSPIFNNTSQSRSLQYKHTDIEDTLKKDSLKYPLKKMMKFVNKNYYVTRRFFRIYSNSQILICEISITKFGGPK